jgi:S1-C subfamily serine protease
MKALQTHRKKDPMDWTTQDEHEEVVEPAAAQPTRHVHRLHLSSVVVAFILVITSLGLGVYVGHDMLKASNSAIKPVSSSLPFPFGNQGLGNQGRRPSTSTPSSGSTSSSSAAVTKVADSVDQGLVDITTNLSYQGASAAGTGMILSANGLVLTNNHVIDGATSIAARDVATNKVYKVKVVGYDVTQDVALLKLENASGLTTVTTGNSVSLTVGQKVIGVGNAGGLGGTPSVATGKVVALDQTITASDQGSAVGSEQLGGTIESNANIQPGDSGGPLVTTKGKVVGMDTAGSTGNQGFGFGQTTTFTQAYSIPINTALGIAKSIEAGDSSATVHVGATAFIGIEAESTTDAAATGSAFGAQGGASGAVIVQILSGTSASQSALVPGDVITSINGQTVSTPQDLATILETLKPGASMTIGYTSESGASATLSLQLGSGPPQ